MKKMMIMICIILLQSISLLAVPDTTCLRFSDISGDLEARPNLPYNLTSSHFVVHYDANTTANYAEKARDYAEEAYTRMCTQRSWLVPPPDEGRGGDTKYDIYILQGGEKGMTVNYRSQFLTIVSRYAAKKLLPPAPKKKGCLKEV